MAPKKNIVAVHSIEIKNWASSQKREYTRLRKGLDSKMTQRRLLRLKSIDFEWTAAKDKNIDILTQDEVTRIDAAGIGCSSDDVTWDCMFEKYWSDILSTKMSPAERKSKDKKKGKQIKRW